MSAVTDGRTLAEWRNEINKMDISSGGGKFWAAVCHGHLDAMEKDAGGGHRARNLILERRLVHDGGSLVDKKAGKVVDDGQLPRLFADSMQKLSVMWNAQKDSVRAPTVPSEYNKKRVAKGYAKSEEQGLMAKAAEKAKETAKRAAKKVAKVAEVVVDVTPVTEKKEPKKQRGKKGGSMVAGVAELAKVGTDPVEDGIKIVASVGKAATAPVRAVLIAAKGASEFVAAETESMLEGEAKMVLPKPKPSNGKTPGCKHCSRTGKECKDCCAKREAAPKPKSKAALKRAKKKAENMVKEIEKRNDPPKSMTYKQAKMAQSKALIAEQLAAAAIQQAEEAGTMDEWSAELARTEQLYTDPVYRNIHVGRAARPAPTDSSPYAHATSDECKRLFNAGKYEVKCNIGAFDGLAKQHAGAEGLRDVFASHAKRLARSRAFAEAEEPSRVTAMHADQAHRHDTHVARVMSSLMNHIKDHEIMESISKDLATVSYDDPYDEDDDDDRELPDLSGHRADGGEDKVKVTAKSTAKSTTNRSLDAPLKSDNSF